MKTISGLGGLFVVALMGFAVLAQDTGNALSGNHLYRAYCLVCHGVTGNAPGPLAVRLKLYPADLSSQHYQAKTAAELADIIAGYRKSGESNMPNWGMVLPRQDQLDIAAYVTSLTRNDLKFRGNTRRGRAIFKSACVACHGEFGKGRGLLAHMMRIAMVDFTATNDMNKISDERLMNTVRHGKGDFMPAWSGILNDNQVADVAAYVRMLAR